MRNRRHDRQESNASPRKRLAYAIGVINTSLSQARDTGRAFGDIASRKHRSASEIVLAERE